MLNKIAKMGALLLIGLVLSSASYSGVRTGDSPPSSVYAQYDAAPMVMIAQLAVAPDYQYVTVNAAQTVALETAQLTHNVNLESRRTIKAKKASTIEGRYYKRTSGKISKAKLNKRQNLITNQAGNLSNWC